MSTVEYEPGKKILEVSPEKRDSQNLSEFGIQQKPVVPQDLRDKNGQVIAQSVGDDSDGTVQNIEIPYSLEEIKEMRKEGSVSDSRKWFLAMWWRGIKIALGKGIRVVTRQA